MRNTIYATLLLAILLLGCGETAIKVEEKTMTYTDNGLDIKVRHPEFSSRDANLDRKCRIVNERVVTLIDSLQNDLKTQLKEYLQEAKETNMEPMIPFTLEVQDSIFMSDDHYISLRLEVYTLTGGANGLTEYYAFNYNVKQGNFLEPDQILNYDKSAAIDKQLQTNFKNPDNCFTDMPTIANVTVVNFTREDICFTYAPLVLGAHYCGATMVSVPRMILKGDLLLK